MLSLLWLHLENNAVKFEQSCEAQKKFLYVSAVWTYIIYQEVMSKRLFMTNRKQVSEAKNACLSLSSSDEDGEDGGDPDLHQCGHCKLMFNNLTKYITHKIQKECWLPPEPRPHPGVVDEDLSWSPERNDLSSPDLGSNKDEIEDEHADQQPDIEIKNLHHDIQKRKDRKGYVRRIKPSDQSDDQREESYEGEGEGGEMTLHSHHEDEEEMEKEDEDDEEDSLEFDDSKKQTDKIDFNKNNSDFLSEDSKESKGRGYYNNNSPSRKPYPRTDQELTEKENSKRSHDQQSKSKHPYNDLMEQTRNVRPYNYPNASTSNKYDRIPSNLPQIMSTRGSSRHQNAFPPRKSQPRDVMSRDRGDREFLSERTGGNNNDYNNNSNEYRPSSGIRPGGKPYSGERGYPNERTYPNDRGYPGDHTDRQHRNRRSHYNERLPRERAYGNYGNDRGYQGDRRFPGNDYDRYHDDLAPPRYHPTQEAETASTWTSNYVGGGGLKGNGESPLEKLSKEARKEEEQEAQEDYRTMVNFKPVNEEQDEEKNEDDEQQQQQQQQQDTQDEPDDESDLANKETADDLDDTLRVVESSKSEDEEDEEEDEEETDKLKDVDTGTTRTPDAGEMPKEGLPEPPQLMRVEKIGKDKLDYSKSPPSLEKCASADTFNDDKDDVKMSDVDVGDAPLDHLTDDSRLHSSSMDVNDSQEGEGSPGGGGMDLSSPEKESNSPQDSNHSHETEDYTQDTRDSSDANSQAPLRRLSESTVERLITVPASVGSDASWKHAKQVYSCPLCAKVFPFKSKLQRHVLVHTGIKPYKCTVCGRGFTQQIDLQRHLTRHTGEKPFKCHLCTAQFIRADNLRKHCKDSHYVNIEEPIRKRRRKTTGSDTVLPSLEVAIALAFSETERNGGRVLGRAVTRSNPRSVNAPLRTNAHIEEGTQGNYHPPGSRPDAPPYGGGGGYHSDMFSPRQSVGYATFPGKMSTQHPAKLEGRFPGKPDAPYSGKPRDAGQFYDADANQPYPGRRREYGPGGDVAGRGHYQGNMGPRGDYDADMSDYYSSRDRPRDVSTKPGSRDPQADHSSHPRYMPPAENRAQAPYPSRREEEEATRPPSNDPDYQGRRLPADQPNIPHRKYDRPDDYTDDPRVSAENSRYSGGFPPPRDGKEPEESGGTFSKDDAGESRDVTRDISAPYLQRTTSVAETTSSPYVRNDNEKDDHLAAFRDKPSFNYGDYGPVVPNRSPDLSRRPPYGNPPPPRDSTRPPYEYEGGGGGGNYGFNKSTANAESTSTEPSDYVALASGGSTNGGNDDGGGGGGVGEGVKENEIDSLSEDVKPKDLIKCSEAQSNVFMGDDEIPIVTRSDELEET